MLEYGSVTGLPDKYRITLAISVALLLHTLVMAALPFASPNLESHRQTVKVELVRPGDIPLPESAANATSPSSNQRESVAVESPQIDTSQPRKREQTENSAPPPPTAVVEQIGRASCRERV